MLAARSDAVSEHDQKHSQLSPTRTTAPFPYHFPAPPPRTSTTTTIPNSLLNSNNTPNPLISLRIPSIKSNQHIQRSLQQSFLVLSALIPIPLNPVNQIGQFHQSLKIFLQSGRRRFGEEERFGRCSGFADEEFEEVELGCEEDGFVFVVVGFVGFEFWDVF
jgi:hypothetical protein